MIGGKPPNPHLKSYFINQSGLNNIGGGFCSFTKCLFQLTEVTKTFIISYLMLSEVDIALSDILEISCLCLNIISRPAWRYEVFPFVCMHVCNLFGSLLGVIQTDDANVSWPDDYGRAPLKTCISNMTHYAYLAETKIEVITQFSFPGPLPTQPA